MSVFKGSAVALVTPFTKEGVNLPALDRMLDFHLANSTDAIVVLGTTGEPSTMTTAEKQQVIDFTVRKIDGKVPVIVGTGTNSTAAAVENTVNAEKLGADAVLVVTPYYNKCSQEGLFRHYEQVCGCTGLPVISYNVPGRTGVCIRPETLARMAEIKNFVAIKEASGDISLAAEYARLCGHEIDMYSGNDDMVVPLLSLGAQGVISVIANLVPRSVHHMCELWFSGRYQEARNMQLHLNPLSSAVFMDVNPIPVKMAVNYMGFEAGPLRLPLCEMNEANTRKLYSVLDGYGLKAR